MDATSLSSTPSYKMDGADTSRMERSDSFGSLDGSQDFIKEMIGDEMRNIAHISDEKKRENMGELLPEPLLVPDKTRFVLFPIQHTDIWDMYKKVELL